MDFVPSDASDLASTVKMSDEFTVREAYFKFKWNNYCELGGANEFFLRVDPFY